MAPSTPADGAATPARGFREACEAFCDAARASDVDGSAVDAFRREARKAAARAASDAARLQASEHACVRARQDRDRAERERGHLEHEVTRLRRAVSNEPFADIRREHSSFDRLKDLFENLRNSRRNGSRVHITDTGIPDSDSDGRCPPSPCWSSPVPFVRRREPAPRAKESRWCCVASDEDDRDARLVFAAPASPLRSPPRSPLFLEAGRDRLLGA
jgi:hypothetical protein